MADSSIIGSALISAEKIREKLNMQGNITLNNNFDQVLSGINSIKKQLEEFRSARYTIDISVNDAEAINRIKNLSNGLNDINGKSKNGARRGGKLPQGASSFPVSRRVWAEKYRDAMAAQVKQYEKDLRDKGADILSTSVRAKYDKTGKATGYEGIVQYRTELGKTTQAVLSLDRATGVYKVNSTRVTENFMAQQKAMEKTQKTISDQKTAIKDLESSAFNQKNPLSGDFRTEAETAINAWKTELQAIEASGKSISSEAENRLKTLQADARRVVSEQKDKQWGGHELASKDITSEKAVAANNLDIQIEKFKQAGIESDELKGKLEGLKTSLAGVSDQKGLQEWMGQFREVKSEIEKVKQETTTFEQSAAGMGQKLAQNLDTNQLDKIYSMINKVSTVELSTPGDVGFSNLSEVIARFEELGAAYEKVKAQLNDPNISQDQYEALKGTIKDLDNELSQLLSKTNMFGQGVGNEQALAQYQQKVENLKLTFEQLEKTYANLIANNPDIASKFQAVKANIENINPLNINEVAGSVRNIGKECAVATGQSAGLRGALTDAFGGLGQYLSRFTSGLFLVTKAISIVKSMVNEVKELDSSLVELQKVTNLSGDSLASFTDRAYEIGAGLGRTGKDVIDAVTTFSRAGYNLTESTELAKSALVMSNVGVDIPNMESAASDMISILKAFDIQASDSMKVIDKLYNVANKEPLDFGNITDMLVTSGGTLAQTNTTLEQTMGLLTGGFATLRDNSVANGLVMISQRLRGVKEDGEAIGDGFMPKLEKALGNIGISIQDENGELRSTFDILDDLAKKWDTLSSKQRQYLGEKIAGNRQVKVLNAIMANWDVVEDTIANADNATNAAMEGNEKYLDSIQGRITEFKSAFSDLARTTIDSGFIKGIVSIGTGILNVTKNIGGLVPVITTIIGLITVIKGQKIADGIKGIFQAIKTMFTGASGLTALTGKIGLILTAIGAIAIIANAINSSKKSINDYVNEANEAKSDYSNQQSKLKGINDELKETQTLIDELNAKDKLTIVEKDELDRLEEKNKKLERQKELQEAITENLMIRARKKAIKAVNEYGTGDYLNNNNVLSSYDIDDRHDAQNYIGEDNIHLFDMYGGDWLLYFANWFTDPVSKKKHPYFTREEMAKANAKAVQDLEKIMVPYKEAELNGTITNEQKNTLSQYEEWYNASMAWLSDYWSFLDEQLGDFDYIDSPHTKDEKQLNRRLDYYNDLGNFILKRSQNGKQEQSDVILGRHEKEREAIEQYIQENGKITEEQLGKIAPNIFQDFLKMGWESADTVQHINEVFLEGVDTNKKYTSTLDELMQENYLATDSYKELSSAIAEQEKNGHISLETYDKLMTTDENLAKYLVLTADGYALNTEALNEYIDTQTKSQKLDAEEAIVEKTKKLEELKNKYDELVVSNASYEDLSANLQEQEGIQNDIDALSAYIRELDGATSALERYRAAKKTANGDEDYNEGTNAYKDIQEGLKTGKAYTDDVKSAVDFMLGDDWGIRYGSYEDALKAAEKTGKRYFGQKDERTGMDNFFKDVANAGFGTYDSKTGKFEMGDNNGKAWTLDEIAQKMGISKDAAKSMFDLSKDYGYDFQFPEIISDEEAKNLEKRSKQIENATNTLEKVGKKREALEDKHNKGEIDDKTYTEQKAALDKSEKFLTEHLKDLENGEGIDFQFNFDSVEEAQSKFDQLKETIETLNESEINIPIEFTLANGRNTLTDGSTDLGGSFSSSLLKKLAVEADVDWQNLDAPPEPEPINIEADTSGIKGEIDSAIPEEKEVTVTETVKVKEEKENKPTPTNKETAVTEKVNADMSGFVSSLNSATSSLAQPVTKPVNADTSAALSKNSSLESALGRGVTKTVSIQVSGSLPRFAKGTQNAKEGLSLVDEEGAELIEHKKQGTFELGTNKGARFTNLDAGDVVHTASQTKRILSRLARIGGFFKDGINQARSIITGGAHATGITGGGQGIWKALTSNARSTIKNGKQNSSKSKGLSTANFKKWIEKLFDWAEVRLARLKTITNSWLLEAAEAIGYIAKNKELSNAINSVKDEIEATSAAYDLYIKQADTVAKKAKLSDDIVRKIQQGEIQIGEYSKDTQEKIKAYQTWYDKAMNCVDALNELKEQERELAKQKLDNIIQHYNNRITRLDNVVSQREADIALATARGQELQSAIYDASIVATTSKLENLVAEKNALDAELSNLVSQGLIEKESDTWFEYSAQLQETEKAITETKTAIIDLQDTANKVKLTKLGYELDALTNSASYMNDMMSLHSAQGIDELAEAYLDLIENGMKQIQNLEEQNKQYREQQKGLDVLSEKYQELEQNIQSNISAIDNMKVSQEGWNDSVLDLKIEQLEKYKDKLSKTNEQYDRQKQLQEAIEDLQKAQSQRTNKIYKDGVGFVFEADQDAVKDAQEKLEDVIEKQLLSRIDDLIDALNEQKNDTNVYDAQGNLLGTQYTLPQLGSLTEILSNYYSANTVPMFSGLKGSLYDQIVSGAINNNKSMQFSFGDINLSEVNDVNTLGEAIVDLLPNAILQAMGKRQ